VLNLLNYTNEDPGLDNEPFKQCLDRFYIKKKKYFDKKEPGQYKYQA